MSRRHTDSTRNVTKAAKEIPRADIVPLSVSSGSLPGRSLASQASNRNKYMLWESNQCGRMLQIRSGTLSNAVRIRLYDHEEYCPYWFPRNCICISPRFPRSCLQQAYSGYIPSQSSPNEGSRLRNHALLSWTERGSLSRKGCTSPKSIQWVSRCDSMLMRLESRLTSSRTEPQAFDRNGCVSSSAISSFTGSESYIGAFVLRPGAMLSGECKRGRF